MPLDLAIIGTDTGVGKTRVAALLVRGLRSLGRRVWIHKPVACGGWADEQAEDARLLAPLCGDGQDPATVCPRQFVADAAPHLAAQAQGEELDYRAMCDAIAALRSPERDLVVEGVGGALVPISNDYRTIADLVAEAGLPVLVVARPRLGTLNHTALTIEALHARRIPVYGVVVNWTQGHGDDDLAATTAAREIRTFTGRPVLAEIPHSSLLDDELGRRLARTLLSLTPA